MNLSNDSINGYLAALRNVQNSIEAISREDSKLLAQGALEPIQYKGAQCVCTDLLEYIEEQRQSYKDLVNQLNKEVEAKDG